MLRRLLVLAVLGLPVLASAQSLGFRDARASAPLSDWDLGRVRMYLESAATACSLSRKRPLDGEYPIALALDARGQPRRVAVRGAATMARCLEGILRGVRFPQAGAPYRWEGVLRVGVTAGLGIAVLDFERLSALHGDTLRNTIVARLEALPACARELLADGTSVAVRATLRAEADGVLAPPRVELSTYAPAALVPCLAEHLAGLRFPASSTYTEVKLFFHILQATDKAPDDVPTVMIKEPAPR